jgi:hypothetical protein
MCCCIFPGDATQDGPITGPDDAALRALNPPLLLGVSYDGVGPNLATTSGKQMCAPVTLHAGHCSTPERGAVSAPLHAPTKEGLSLPSHAPPSMHSRVFVDVSSCAWLQPVVFVWGGMHVCCMSMHVEVYGCGRFVCALFWGLLCALCLEASNGVCYWCDLAIMCGNGSFSRKLFGLHHETFLPYITV